MSTTIAKGRPRRNAEFDRLYESLPKLMDKRPSYLHGIGVFRGQRGDTAWVKVRLPTGGTYKGKALPAGSAVEIKVGRLASFTWDQLLARRDELQGKADRGEPLEEAPVVTFGDWADDWLTRAKQRVRAYVTLELHVRLHLKPEFGAKALNAITGQDINRWVTKKSETAARGTVRREFNTFRAILNDAVRAGLIERNPCQNAEPVKGGAGRMRFLEAEEVVTLLTKAQETADWLPDFILWSLHSGMRKGETCALRWPDIRRIEDRTVALIADSKSGRPRPVACTQTMVEILERQWERKVEDDERVFPVAAMTLRRAWEDAREAAELDDINLHDLRRTNATLAAASGVDLRTLADRLGHADLGMLQKHYAALVGSKVVEAADAIQKAIDRLVQPKINR